MPTVLGILLIAVVAVMCYWKNKEMNANDVDEDEE